MLSKEISEKILTIGCAYKSPKGGVAQVMYNYEQFVFPEFKCIVNSGGENSVQKLAKATGGWLNMVCTLIFDRNIKIVHIHTASYNSFKRSAYFVKLAKYFNKKVILHIHGGGFKEYFASNPKWIASILNSSDVIITLSDSWKQYYQSITKGVKIFVVENIVAPPVEKQVMKDEKCHLLFLGIIDELKGIFDLVDVLCQHADTFRKKLILHIGGGGKVIKLKKIVEQYDLADMVIYEGFVSGSKKTDLLLSCDALILPSYVEGLPVSILEAMSYGKAILSTPVGGIPNVVIPNENGLIFQPGDKNEIYNVLKTFMLDSELRENMGRLSKLKAKSYLPENVTSSLLEVYKYLQ